MMRPVRRWVVALSSHALAAATAFGLVASALAVPLAHRGATTDAMVGLGAPCHVDGAPDAHHAGHGAVAPAEAPPADDDRHPTPDHFDCCNARLGTTGTPALVLTLAQRLEPAGRRARVPRPRMPSRPRPWRVSLGRHPPLGPTGSMLAA